MAKFIERKYSDSSVGMITFSGKKTNIEWAGRYQTSEDLELEIGSAFLKKEGQNKATYHIIYSVIEESGITKSQQIKKLDFNDRDALRLALSFFKKNFVLSVDQELKILDKIKKKC